MFQLIKTLGDDILLLYFKDNHNVYFSFPKGKKYLYLINYVLDQMAYELKIREVMLSSKAAYLDSYQLSKFFYDEYSMEVVNNVIKIETHKEISNLYNAIKKSVDNFPPSYEEYKKHCNVLLAISSDEDSLQIVESNDIFLGDFVTNFDPKKFYECVYFIATHNI